jgi:hypothetical protein
MRCAVAFVAFGVRHIAMALYAKVRDFRHHGPQPHKDSHIMRHISSLLILAAAAVTPAAAFAQPAPVDIAAARAALTGTWAGKLEYLDYSANKWFGIPVNTQIEDQGDGATIIRKSDFDDGPKVGNVRITSIELLDPAAGTVTTGTFRKGRSVETFAYAVRFDGTPADTSHWTMVEEALGKDDDRPAMLRLTTTRDGDSIETLKQIDFQDDDKTEWITRNRTRLSRIGG